MMPNSFSHNPDKNETTKKPYLFVLCGLYLTPGGLMNGSQFGIIYYPWLPSDGTVMEDVIVKWMV